MGNFFSKGIKALTGGIAATGIDKDFLHGTDDELDFYDTLTPEQKQTLEPLWDQLGGLNSESLKYIQSILSEDPNALEQFEAPLMEQFKNKTIPAIMERFAGQGANSGLNTSLAQAGRSYSKDIAGLRAGLKQNAVQNLQQWTQQANQPTKQAYIKGGQKGLFDYVAPAAADIGTAYAKSSLGI